MRDGADTSPIAVAGAGIAGLSAAIALRLARFPVRVFEREPQLQAVGAGIQLGPNATRILRDWGVRIPESACEPESIELRSARSGALLNAIPLGPEARARYGAPYLTLLRADLQEALLSRAAELDCEVKLASPVGCARPVSDRVSITAGEEKLYAAALIGADGLGSAVRRYLPSCPQPGYTQTIAWRALLPPASVPAPARSAITLWMGPGAHLVYYPVSGAAAINAVLVIEDWRAKGVSGVAEKEPLPHLLEALRDWADAPLSAIAASAEWRPWLLCRANPCKGGAGRIQLIGDAWHAMAPFLASGGVMAIEDAEALASSLPREDEGMERGLELFRQRRLPRLKRAYFASSRMGRIYHFPKPFDAIRDAAIRASSGKSLLASNDWLYGARV